MTSCGNNKTFIDSHLLWDIISLLTHGCDLLAMDEIG